MSSRKSVFPFKRLLITIICGLLIVFLINQIMAFLNGPSAGESTQSEPQTETPAPPETTRDLTTEYYSLVYASKLDTVSDISGGDKTALEVYRLAARGLTSRRTLTITVKKLPPEAFEGESSYLLRHRSPETYERQEVRVGEAEFVLFEKSDGTEVVAFNRRADKMVILAYTVSSTDIPPRTELLELLAGFSWR